MRMSGRGKAEERIGSILKSSRLAVLATQHGGQPHASVVAFTPIGGIGRLVFATYRDTLKYRSLLADGRVALLIGSGGDDAAEGNGPSVVTAVGVVGSLTETERLGAMRQHLRRHPELGDFLESRDCALVAVDVSAYEVVGGVDDVTWYELERTGT
jgi:hypothetical protein